MNKIVKGAIVKFKDPQVPAQKGFFRVTAVRGFDSVNMSTPWGRKVILKGYSKRYLVECEDEWYAAWQKSDQYQTM